MAKKVFKLKEIAHESDYVQPVVSSGTGPISLQTMDGFAFFSYDDSEVTVDASGTNASKYGVKVLDASDADDLADLQALRNTVSIAMEVAKKVEDFEAKYPKVVIYDAIINDVSAVKTAVATLKTDVNAIYANYGLPAIA